MRLPDGTHATAGDVAVVSDDKDGLRGTSKKGEIPLASCAPGAVSAATWGAGSTIPPLPGTPPPQGMMVRFTMPGGGAVLVANVSRTATVEASPYYMRTWRGRCQGGVGRAEREVGVLQVLQFPEL